MEAEGLTTILHLRASPFLGGPEKQILGSVPYLQQRGFSVVVGSFVQGSEGRDLLLGACESGVRALAIRSRGPLDFSPVHAVLSEIRAQGVSLLCAHDAKSSVIGHLAARRAHIPLLVWSRGWTSETLRVRLYNRMNRLLLRRADHVVAVSRAQAGACRQCGVAADRLSVIPNAVQPAPPADIGPGLRDSLGLPASARVVLSVGRLSPEKGHRHLVSAAPAVLAACPDSVFVLIGDGIERRALERAAERLGVADRVVFAGFRRNAASLMAQSDLLVLPSISEGLPNVVLEAFAARVPVVATNVGGVGEVVRTDTGWLVHDPSELAPAIVEALDSPMREERTAAGHALVTSQFSFARQAELIAGVFRRALDAQYPARPALARERAK